jgi:hypothetical protein
MKAQIGCIGMVTAVFCPYFDARWGLRESCSSPRPGRFFRWGKPKYPFERGCVIPRANLYGYWRSESTFSFTALNSVRLAISG